MTITATRYLLDKEECGFHLILCTSSECAVYFCSRNVPKKIGVEAADMFVPMTQRGWCSLPAPSMHRGSHTARVIRSVMYKKTDERLGTTIASFRQALWRRRGETIGEPMLADELPSETDVA